MPVGRTSPTPPSQVKRYRDEDILFATDLPATQNRLVMTSKNYVYLEGTNKGGKQTRTTYHLDNPEDRVNLRKRLEEDFKKAVKTTRPLIHGAGEQKLTMPVPPSYALATQKYRKIISDLESIPTLYGQIKSDINYKSYELAMPQITRLFHQEHIPRIAREIAEFGKTYVTQAARNPYATYGIKDGIITTLSQNVFARGWRKIAGLFKIGRNYYQVKATKSLFDALTSKYSERDILDTLNRILRTSPSQKGMGFFKDIETFDETTLNRLNAMGKLSLVEELEVRRRSASKTEKAMLRLKIEVPKILKRLEGYTSKGKAIPKDVAETLATAFYVNTLDPESTIIKITTMNPEDRTKLAKDITQANSLTEQFIAAVGNQDKTKANALITQLYGLILKNAPIAQGKPISGTDDVVSVATIFLSRLYTMPRSMLGVATERFLDWEDIFDSTIQFPAAWAKLLKPQKSAADATSLLSHMGFVLMNASTALLNDSRTSNSAKLSWQQVMLDKITLDKTNNLKITPAKTKASLGSRQWRTEATSTKAQFIKTLEAKYLAPRNGEPSPIGRQPHISKAVAERLAQFGESSQLLTRKIALDLVRHLAEEERLAAATLEEQYPDRTRVTKALRNYQIDGVHWIRLATQNNINPKDINFHRVFYRRLQDKALDDSSFLVALETLEAHRAENRDFAVEQQATDKVANRMLVRLAHKATNHPKDWQALVKLDTESYDIMDKYVLALQQNNFTKLREANRDLSGLVVRYLTLDPTVNPFADDSPLAQRDVTELQITGDTFRQVARLITFGPIGDMDFSEVKKTFANHQKAFGYIVGVLGAYTNQMSINFSDEVQRTSTPNSATGSLAGDSVSQSLTGGSPASSSPLSSASSSPETTPPSSRPHSGFLDGFSTGKMELFLQMQGDFAQRGRRRDALETPSRVRSSLFPDAHTVLTDIPRDAPSKIVAEREQVDLKEVLRCHTDNLFAAMVKALQFASTTKGDLGDAEAIRMGFEDAKSEANFRVGEYLGETEVPEEHLSQTVASIADMEETVLPPQPQRKALLDDFEVFNKQQGLPLRNLFTRLNELHRSVLDAIAS